MLGELAAGSIRSCIRAFGRMVKQGDGLEGLQPFFMRTLEVRIRVKRIGAKLYKMGSK